MACMNPSSPPRITLSPPDLEVRRGLDNLAALLDKMATGPHTPTSSPTKTAPGAPRKVSKGPRIVREDYDYTTPPASPRFSKASEAPVAPGAPFKEKMAKKLSTVDASMGWEVVVTSASVMDKAFAKTQQTALPVVIYPMAFNPSTCTSPPPTARCLKVPERPQKRRYEDTEEPTEASAPVTTFTPVLRTEALLVLKMFGFGKGVDYPVLLPEYVKAWERMQASGPIDPKDKEYEMLFLKVMEPVDGGRFALKPLYNGLWQMIKNGYT